MQEIFFLGGGGVTFQKGSVMEFLYWAKAHILHSKFVMAQHQTERSAVPWDVSRTFQKHTLRIK